MPEGSFRRPALASVPWGQSLARGAGRTRGGVASNAALVDETRTVDRAQSSPEQAAGSPDLV
jgi:hypothetical protein